MGMVVIGTKVRWIFRPNPVSLNRGVRRFLVTFRMVVFRPSRSEVIIGKVKSSTEDGIRGTSVIFFGERI